MERASTGSRLAEAVQNCALSVVSALRGGHHGGVLEPAGVPDPVMVGAVRVLGADVLAPRAFLGLAPSATDLDLVRAVALCGLAEGASVPVAWMHWGLRAALHAADGERAFAAPVGEPESAWVATVSWPVLTHRLAQLAALAAPNLECTVAAQASTRVPDLARGFARAVRRGDWLQAAGAGRWLAALGGAPASLGLARGMEFVEHFGGAGDARVRLHVQAARLLQEAGP
ncbi:hypothetical protein A8924_5194 [Saccharopolyspora erythraea NRRL 2338]|uniref:Uncharacterized protein n=2 Tax=Saccharopolyspora erythraea TaxID=1836 RepID=A4FJ50_SACEN|nr:hypothetical protein [Saccharopolyspora erythraea]EQD84689.1 hypothetical protein N599_18905 [Saccharopolyspora erythraea D]PFG97745.1 hypothetical protein A8924_5194 [Saccharopolyspora erythraea NRRL 2338]QRK87893.1 hypothetical protein JQX30_24445 [Saccharopolyspora erythraea]CAM04075.1 hypothetical protein SACE_4810 [Saccharopolyspora erythraea NRRL 2338]